MSASITRLDVTGRGQNAGPDNTLIVEAGWDTDATFEGSVQIKVAKPLSNCKIQVELRGFCESKWEFGGRLATKAESESYKVNTQSKIFQSLVVTVYESREAIQPNPMGAATSFPFKLNLPKNNMPPSFSSVSGRVAYIIKCTVQYQETMKLMRTTYDQEFSLTVSMPDTAKIRMLHSSSADATDVPGTHDKVGYSISIPTRIARPGDSLEVNVSINSTPGDTKLRLINASLRPLITYFKEDKTPSVAKFPRPLSEMSQSFPLLKVGGSNGCDPIKRRLFLLVDPDVAKGSVDSPLVSVKTVFRLQVTLDNSEYPNVSAEIPIIIVPHLKEDSVPLSPPLQLSDGSSRMSNFGQAPPYSPRSDSVGYGSPTLHAYPASIASSRQFSVHSLSLPEARLPLHHRNNSLPSPSKDSVTYVVNGMQTLELSEGNIMRKHSLTASPRTDYMSDSDSSSNISIETPRESWSIEMVASWIGNLGGSPEVVQSFIDNGIDGGVLLGLSASDLREELGVTAFGLRRKITMAIGSV
ncbi:UNVERIFIED_CONTAM: hypothetical protein HDU68_006136 [Siphonaria sp. JEL0065]|nr:hypothetical protein HDU68_006136 [Siphonaria sp. JEL0065]